MSSISFIILGWIVLAIYTYYKTGVPRNAIVHLKNKLSILGNETSSIDKEKVKAYKKQIAKEKMNVYIAIIIYFIVAILLTMLINNT